MSGNIENHLKHGNNAIAWLVVTAGLLLLPLALGQGYYLSAMNFIALYSMVAIGVCLLTGYGGQLALSHGAFFAIGAYCSSILSLRAGLPPWISVIASQGFAALVAWGIGAVVLRLKGHYLAIASLAFAMIVEKLSMALADLTGGSPGLTGIPRLSLGGFAIDSDLRFYYVAWPAVMLLQFFALNLVSSRIGRALRCVKEGEEIARLFGVDVRAFKVKLFILSSVYGSLAGSLYAHYVTFVSPSVASIMFAIEILLVLALGGYTMLWGAIVGVAGINLLNEYLSVFVQYKRMIYGLALIVIVLVFPNGLFKGVADRIDSLVGILRTKGKSHAEPDARQ
jgi:branched-chain amino acid transport system permease protein